MAAENAAGLSEVATGTLAGFTPTDKATDLSSLSFRNGAGEPVTLADFSGKTVLLNLWATWCAPCRAEMPSLDNLEDQRGSDDFQVVAVSVDTKTDGRAEKFYEETGIDDLVFFIEPTLTLFNTLKENGLAYGMPTTLLIDGNGCHVGSLNGPAEWDAPEALALVDAALAERDGTSAE
ncbi:thiol-disulfide isomerase/thioredoxin [Amorphus orientalis]|uniref:Thiol-disulfide isomerase/thioredoxin n=1 Tax=Amorphus orientalis TaxID=649198 RepID=A0AAE3VSE8_9HYPH|nr:TlpA disulfide reductase family protein [Amorphus orientalis]MDQ0317103.1 thiol-disulfide isomerase/thioredoxin [Amorphus orientalis]